MSTKKVAPHDQESAASFGDLTVIERLYTMAGVTTEIARTARRGMEAVLAAANPDDLSDLHESIVELGRFVGNLPVVADSVEPKEELPEPPARIERAVSSVEILPTPQASPLADLFAEVLSKEQLTQLLYMDCWQLGVLEVGVVRINAAAIRRKPLLESANSYVRAFFDARGDVEAVAAALDKPVGDCRRVLTNLAKRLIANDKYVQNTFTHALRHVGQREVVASNSPFDPQTAETINGPPQAILAAVWGARMELTEDQVDELESFLSPFSGGAINRSQTAERLRAYMMKYRADDLQTAGRLTKRELQGIRALLGLAYERGQFSFKTPTQLANLTEQMPGGWLTVTQTIHNALYKLSSDVQETALPATSEPIKADVEPPSQPGTELQEEREQVDSLQAKITVLSERLGKKLGLSPPEQTALQLLLSDQAGDIDPTTRENVGFQLMDIVMEHAGELNDLAAAVMRTFLPNMDSMEFTALSKVDQEVSELALAGTTAQTVVVETLEQIVTSHLQLVQES